MREYVAPTVTDFGTLRELTKAHLTGGIFDCNARPGDPFTPNNQTSQPPTC